MNDIQSAISGSRITVGELYDILVDLQANGLIGAKQVQRRSKYYAQFDSPESYNTDPLPDRTKLTEPNIILLKLLKAYIFARRNCCTGDDPYERYVAAPRTSANQLSC